MDNRPIGFFDSGLGGLTCIPYLLKELPDEKFIYFGDTARTPYGSKAVTTIQHFAEQISDFLVKKNVKMIVIACNTVSATCLDLIRERHPEVPVIGIIEPTTDKLKNIATEKSRIGIIGTKVTINSHTYLDKLREKNLNIFEKACPAFVPLIEEGIVENEIMDLTIKYYMDDFIKKHSVNTLVLGCTHYPLIKKNLTKLYPNIEIVNPSKEIIEEIKEILRINCMMAKDNQEESRFYASDLSENFLNMIDKIFGDPEVKVKFKNLDIE